MSAIFERGQVYPLFAIMLTALIGISALSVDIGYYRYQQRIQQAATDSAAVAAGQASFYDSTNGSNPQNAAVADATKNGFINGSGTVTVVANPYTDSGNCASGQNCIGVTISKTYPVFFGSIFQGYGGTKTIATFAAAKLTAVAGACLTSLGSTSTSSTANGGLNGPDCGVADADCSDVHGGPNVTVASFAANAACGNNKWSGGSNGFTYTLPPTDPCSVSPQCQTMANATASQLGLSSLTTNPTCTSAQSQTTNPLVPGCYSGSFTISNQTLNPGLYVFTGTVTFDNTVSGSGVTLYFAQNASYADKTNATVTLTAPTAGDFSPYPNYTNGEEGLLMYQAPGSLWSSKLNADANWTGLMYMPRWDITFAGHDKTFTGNLVVDSFTFNGVNVNLNPGNGATEGAPSQVVLAE